MCAPPIDLLLMNPVLGGYSASTRDVDPSDPCSKAGLAIGQFSWIRCCRGHSHNLHIFLYTVVGTSMLNKYEAALLLAVLRPEGVTEHLGTLAVATWILVLASLSPSLVLQQFQLERTLPVSCREMEDRHQIHTFSCSFLHLRFVLAPSPFNQHPRNRQQSIGCPGEISYSTLVNLMARL